MAEPPVLERDLTPRPMIVVVSGPSGVGKTVICSRVLELEPDLERSVTATSRPRRGEELDGVDYTFWEEERFREGIREGLFLEWAEVHGHLYGTLKARVEAQLARGKSPVLNIDVQGGQSVKALRPDAVLIFLVPPSLEVLESRLRNRGTEAEQDIATRLANARGELEQWVHYDYLVVNDDLEEAVARIRGILAAERARVPRIRGRL